MQENNLTLTLATAHDILRNAIKNFRHNNDISQAAAIAFYGLLSLIPFFLLSLLVVSYFFGTQPQLQKEIITTTKAIHPFFSEKILLELAQAQEKRAIFGGIGILTLFWFSSVIFQSVEKAMETIFRVQTPRRFLTSKILTFVMIPFAWLVGASAVGINYLANIAEIYVLRKENTIFAFLFLFSARYLLPYILIVVLVAILYKVIPKAKISFSGAFLGSLIFSILLLIAKYFFTWYINNYTRYDLIFGPLEAVVLLLIWVFYVASIFLFCAELTASYERRDLILLEEALIPHRGKNLKTEERLYRKFGRFYPAGTYLFQEGDKSNEMFIILNGKVNVVKKAGEVTKLLTELGKGDYLGEMAALIDAPRTATAFVAKDSYIAVITGEVFRTLLRESDTVSLNMLQEFARRIRHTNAVLEEVTEMSIKFFVLLYLLKEWPLSEERDPVEELSNITKRTTKEIAGILAHLEKEGIIFTEQGKIISIDKKKVDKLIPK